MGFFMVVLVPLHPVSEKADIIADMTISTQVTHLGSGYCIAAGGGPEMPAQRMPRWELLSMRRERSNRGELRSIHKQRQSINDLCSASRHLSGQSRLTELSWT